VDVKTLRKFKEYRPKRNNFLQVYAPKIHCRGRDVMSTAGFKTAPCTTVSGTKARSTAKASSSTQTAPNTTVQFLFVTGFSAGISQLTYRQWCMTIGLGLSWEMASA